MRGEDTDRLYVRRRTGEVVGPVSSVALGALVRQGKLDGTEQVSTDGLSWRALEDADLDPAAVRTPESPEVQEFPAAQGGTEVIPSDLQMKYVSLSPPDDEGEDAGFGVPADTSEPAARASSTAEQQATWGERDLGAGPELPPLEIGFVDAGAPAATAAPPEPPGVAALEMPDISLAALELETPSAASGTGTPEGPAGGPGERPLTEFLPSPGSGDAMGLAPLPSASEPAPMPPLGPLGALGSSDAGAPATPAVLAGAAAAGLDAGARATPAAALISPKTTLSAAKPRAARPAGQRRRVLLACAGAAVLLVGGAAALLASGAGEALFGEPPVADILGAAAAEIAGDRVPAYRRGAALLDEAVVEHPKATRLRAASAELLASAVVVRRAERSRLSAAERTLAELPESAAAAPEVRRARAWVALAKGKRKEAERLIADGVGDAGQTALLRGWLEMASGNPKRAARTFREAPAPAMRSVMLRFSAALAEEEAGLPTAAAAYQAVLGQAKSHFGAGLGVIRTGPFAPKGVALLAETLLSKHASEATPAEQAEAWVLLGDARRRLGQRAEAEAAFEKARRADPSSPIVHAAVGETMLAEGRWREAVAHFQQAAPAAPQPPIGVPTRHLWFAMAGALIEGGKPAPGLELLKPTGAAAAGAQVRTERDHARAAFWRARAAELASPPELELAVQSYEEARTADPGFVAASLQLATLLIEARRAPEALRVLKRAETAGAAPLALKVALGQAFLAGGDQTRAETAFKEALAVDATIGLAHLGLASIYESAGRAEAARAELDAVLRHAPETPGVRQHIAELLIGQGRGQEALATYQAEIATGRATTTLRLAAARLALSLGRADVARDIAEAVVREDPQTPGALLVLGRARRAAGDAVGATADLRRALTFETGPEAHLELARTLVVTNREGEALAEYELAGALPDARIERGRLLLRRGDAERAAADLRLATRLAPGDPTAWLLLGNAEERLGQPTKAEAAWRAALKANATDPEVHYRLGRREMDKGRPGQALAHLRQAAGRLPANAPWAAELYFQLGFAEKAGGARASAVSAFRRYLALAPPESPARKEVEDQLALLAP